MMRTWCSWVLLGAIFGALAHRSGGVCSSPSPIEAVAAIIRTAEGLDVATPRTLYAVSGRAAIVGLEVLGQPIEERLSSGSMHLLRAVRQGVRRVLRTVSWSLLQWADWTTSALGLVLIALCAPLLDRQLLRAWREHGFAAFRASLLLALAVYVRLLFDRRAPIIGKVLLVCTVLYGIGPGDLIPDRIAVLGLVDDLLAVGLASRVFARLCPDWLVEEHAAKAARAWQRARRARFASAGTSLPKRSQPMEGHSR